MPLEPSPTVAEPGAATGEAIGQVSTVQGSATVTRANAGPLALRIADPIYLSDELSTGANASLGVTFDDDTTFSLSGDARIVVDDYLYRQGGSGNSAAFSIAVGTVGFIASAVARSGTMTITTPTATMGIRGTTGVVDVPANAAAGGDAKIKLYADADGHVGHIDVFNRQGARLGSLVQSASAFEIRRGPNGRFAAVPFRIPPREAARDRGVVQRLIVSHNIGRRMTIQRRQFRLRNQRPNNLRQPNHLRGNGPQQRKPTLRERLRKRNPVKRREPKDQR